jgi:hypothetical protein
MTSSLQQTRKEKKNMQRTSVKSRSHPLLPITHVKHGFESQVDEAVQAEGRFLGARISRQHAGILIQVTCKMQ